MIGVFLVDYSFGDRSTATSWYPLFSQFGKVVSIDSISMRIVRMNILDILRHP